MKEAIFIDSWLKFDKKSRNRFLLFVESPYFNRNTKLIQALKYIDRHKRLDDVENFKKDLFTHLFPDTFYQDSKIRYILSDLTGLLKKFISIEFDQQQPVQAEFELTNTIRKLEMDKLFRREWNKLSNSISNPKYQNATNQFYTYKYHLEAQNLESIKSRKGYKYLPEAFFNLEAHFIAESLRLACLNAGPQAIANLSGSMDFLNSNLKRVVAGDFSDSPAVVIYYHAYQMLYNNDELAYFKLAEWLSSNWKLFPIHEIEDVYLLGINFCISKINSGGREFMKHAFDLYRSGLENKVFMKDGYLSIYNYKNILRLGLTQKAYEWAESFLHKFKEWLPKEEQENAFNYNLAYFYFDKRDYDSCMNLLRTVKFKDVFNNLDSRRMLLRIYYELEEWSALDSHLDSFQSYVVRQKNIGYHKAANLNLVKITRLMMKKFPLSEKSKEQIRKRVKNATQLAEKNWVIKTAEIEEDPSV